MIKPKTITWAVVAFLMGLCVAHALSEPIPKEEVSLQETIYSAEEDGVYISHLNFYSDSLDALIDFAQPYDYGVRQSGIYIIVKDTNAYNYFLKKSTIINIAQSKFKLRPKE